MKIYDIIKKRSITANSLPKKVFLYGSPHAGKSTMLSSVLYYLENSKKHVLRRDPINNPHGVRLIMDIKERIDCGLFPRPTKPEFWTDVGIEYNIEEIHKLHKFLFLEIPGEVSEKIEPAHEKNNEVSNEIRNFLENCNGAMIVAASNPEGTLEKEHMNNFLEYFIRVYPKKPVLMILTKYDEIYNKFGDKYLEAAESLYRNSFKLLKQHDLGAILPFSVGEVLTERLEDSNDSDKNIKKIRYFNTDKYVPEILAWMEDLK